MKNHWLSLEAVLRSIPTIAHYNVSEVARGIKSSNQTDEGFVEAYIATNGSPDKMAQRLTGRNDHETWADRRMQFNTRHYGQVKKNKEKLWQKNGDPTRRHLGLIAWGWSPAKEHKRLEKWLESQPTMESGEWKKYVGARRNPRSVDRTYKGKSHTVYPSVYKGRQPSVEIGDPKLEILGFLKSTGKLFIPNRSGVYDTLLSDLEGIIVDPLDPSRPSKYAKAYKKGDQFPPIEIEINGNRVTLIDGHHRLAGAKLAKLPYIKVRWYIPNKRRNKMAAGYQSYAWISQDWRSVFLHKDRISYDKKCGAKGTRLPSGKPRLCLPLEVIEELLRTKKGKSILRKQAEKKQRAPKGTKVPWHSEISRLHKKLEKESIKDKRRKNGYKSVIEGTIGITIDGKDYVLRNNPPLDRDYWLPVGLKHRLEILYQKDYGHPDLGGFMDVGAENYHDFGDRQVMELGTGVTVYLYMDMYDFQGRDKYPKGLVHTPEFEKQGELHLRLSDPSEVFPECKKDLDAVLDELTQRGIERFKVYEVAFSDLYHKEYRGEGLGEFMYEGALQLSGILGETVILVGDACSFEFDPDWKDDPFRVYDEDATSPSAERVYESLQRRYIGKGLIVSSVLKSGSVETRGWYWNKGEK